MEISKNYKKQAKVTKYIVLQNDIRRQIYY